jgi:Tfp pilus assembly protein PilF
LRGKVMELWRRRDDAEKDFRRAVEYSPESAAAQATLAGLLYRLGHTREAIYHYELARRSRPANPATLLGLARALIDDAEFAEAQRRLDELLADHPDHPDGLVERGGLALQRSQPAEAEPFLARAVRAAPWHRDGNRLYLIVLKQLGRTEAVSECEARLAKLKAEDAAGGRLIMKARNSAGDPGVCWEVSQWCLRNGRDEEAVAWLMGVVRQAPRHAGAQAALADYFDRTGQPRRAALHRAAAGPG